MKTTYIRLRDDVITETGISTPTRVGIMKLGSVNTLKVVAVYYVLVCVLQQL